MMRMTGGTNSVATIRPKTTLRPRNCTRASGWAAMAGVATTSAALAAAAIMLLANHRSTGVPDEPRMLVYAWTVGALGIQVGGTPAASTRDLNDVTSMNTSGLTKISARTTSST